MTALRHILSILLLPAMVTVAQSNASGSSRVTTRWTNPRLREGLQA